MDDSDREEGFVSFHSSRSVFFIQLLHCKDYLMFGRAVAKAKMLRRSKQVERSARKAVSLSTGGKAVPLGPASSPKPGRMGLFGSAAVPRAKTMRDRLRSVRRSGVVKAVAGSFRRQGV